MPNFYSLSVVQADLMMISEDIEYVVTDVFVLTKFSNVRKWMNFIYCI